MTTSSPEVAVLDTNVLVYATNRAAPQHAACHVLLKRASSGDLVVCLTPQILFEYVGVVTTSKVLPRPMSIEEAASDAERLAQTHRLLQPGPDLLLHTLDLIRGAKTSGRAIFDMAIAATMLSHGVERIYTYNISDFDLIPGLTVLRPPS